MTSQPMTYESFIEQKQFTDMSCGFEINEDDMTSEMMGFQKVIVKWALARGRSAVFADTGLGKTLMQCEWARHVSDRNDAPVLIFAPLAVAQQTQAEAAKFGIHVKYVRDEADMPDNFGIFVTNYEMQSHFNPDNFIGVVLDESSILKNQDGKTRNTMIERWGSVPFRLSCTATPSPNDFTELGNQAQFLGIMSMTEMLAMFFVNDTGNTGTWRLKGHGRQKFWEWLSTWAVFVRKPSDLGFDDEGYDLPPLNITEHVVQKDKTLDGQLFAMPAQTLSERRAAKRDSMNERVALAADLVNNDVSQWIVWCHLNDEQDMLEKSICVDNKDVVASVRGSDKMDAKEERLDGFTKGKYRILITKPSIAGFGMNWQHSNNMIFVGMDDSFEKFYQAVRRQYRFGQKNTVNVHIITSSMEGSVKENITKKQKQHEEMSAEMVEHMRDLVRKKVTRAGIEKTKYDPQLDMEIPTWLK